VRPHAGGARDGGVAMEGEEPAAAWHKLQVNNKIYFIPNNLLSTKYFRRPPIIVNQARSSNQQ
jgi:hypothetical protein